MKDRICDNPATVKESNKGEAHMKKLLCVALASTLFIGVNPVANAAMENFTTAKAYTEQFKDIPVNAWYAPYVKKAYEFGLISGKTTDTFAPQSNLTVAETIALMSRIHAQYHGNDILPSTGAWYQCYIKYGVVQGILNKSWAIPMPESEWNQAVSRDQFVHFLFHALPEEEYKIINTITQDQIHDVSYSEDTDDIYRFYEAGILSGNNKYGVFYPHSEITRAEVSVIITRLIDPSLRISFTLEELPQPVDVTGYIQDSSRKMIEDRLYQEANLYVLVNMFGKTFTRENWRMYENDLLNCLSDRMEWLNMKPIGKYIKVPESSVSWYSVTSSEMESWAQYYYGVDIKNTCPIPGLYTNGQTTVKGSNGIISDYAKTTHIFSLGNDKYYVQFDTFWEASDEFTGSGYAVLHWADDHYQVYEISWDTPQIPDDRLLHHLIAN